MGWLQVKNRLLEVFGLKQVHGRLQMNIALVILLAIAIIIVTQFYGVINTSYTNQVPNVPNAVAFLLSHGYAVAAPGDTFVGDVTGNLTGDVTGSISGGTVSGDGSGLTGVILDGTGTTTGAVPYFSDSGEISGNTVAGLTWTATQQATGRGATIVVAASDATAAEKAQADYLCTTDLSSVIAAIKVAYPSYKISIHLTSGTFPLTDISVFGSNMKLIGSGMGITTIVRNANTLCCITAEGTDQLAYGGSSNMQFSDFTLDVNYDGFAGVRADGFFFAHASYINIERIKVIDWPRQWHAIEFNASKICSVSNCFFESTLDSYGQEVIQYQPCKTGVSGDGGIAAAIGETIADDNTIATYIDIHDNYAAVTASWLTGCHTEVTGTNCTNIHVYHNTMVGGMLFDLQSTDHVEIDNNIVELVPSGQQAIYILSTANTMSDLNIHNNSITFAAGGWAVLATLGGSLVNTQINDNYIYMPTGTSVNCAITLSPSGTGGLDDITIGRNIIDYSGTEDGIYLYTLAGSAARNISIINNKLTIGGAANYGIAARFLNTASNINVDENIVDMSNATNTSGLGIWLSAYNGADMVRHCSLSRNTVIGSPATPINGDILYDFHIDGNIIYNWARLATDRGLYLTGCQSGTVIGNTINTKVTLGTVTHAAIDVNAGNAGAVTSSRIIIQGNIVTTSDGGIRLENNSDYCLVMGNDLSNGVTNIRQDKSSNNVWVRNKGDTAITAGYMDQGEIRSYSGSLSAGTVGNGVIAWQNPNGRSLIISGTTRITTASTAAATGDWGLATTVQIIENCEDVWNVTAPAAGHSTCAVDTLYVERGTNDISITATAGVANADILAWEQTAATEDLSTITHITLKFRSNVALNAGDMSIALDDDADFSSPIAWFTLPAISANTTTLVCLNPNGGAAVGAGYNSIDSIGIRVNDVTRYVAGKIIYLDDIRGITVGTDLVNDANLQTLGQAAYATTAPIHLDYKNNDDATHHDTLVMVSAANNSTDLVGTWYVNGQGE